MSINCKSKPVPYVTSSDSVQEANISPDLFMCNESLPPGYSILSIRVILTTISTIRKFEVRIGVISFLITVTPIGSYTIESLRGSKAIEGLIYSFDSTNFIFTVQFINNVFYPTRQETYIIDLLVIVLVLLGNPSSIQATFIKPQMNRFATNLIINNQ